ncbi:hypothetical protein [Sphingomonas sp. S2-65]|uniref:hypothetical protein n=1 Tax=Sphingomonas sp. S2-65 TaxID=2903960 RepID=UPI001F35D21F|nr:hypothetical protein [Sphingomonas sp. S2-65]UYY57122.1 hypothetical protein LZ586_10525 [Sphingomonas sp. S2-65]
MIMVRLAVCFLVALAGIPSPPVAAQSITQTDHAAIQSRISAFDKMMREGRTDDSLDFVPPRLLGVIAKKFGLSPADVKPSFRQQVAEAMKHVKIVSFRMTLSSATAGVTPNKRRNYMLIPTETVVEVPGAGRILSKSSTLALQENGSWYLVRIDEAEQVLVLRETYPEFAGVEFPRGSTKPNN